MRSWRSPAPHVMRITYAKVLVFEAVVLAALYWLQLAFV